MFDSIKPGELIRCTVTKAPRRDDQRQTIARLMRQDPKIRRSLNHAQHRRDRNMRYKTRGGRPWAIRPLAQRYANVRQDATWTMRYIPHIQPDFRSVAEFVKVESA